MQLRPTHSRYHLSPLYPPHVPPTTLPSYALQWSKDLAIDLEEEDWTNIWTNTKKLVPECCCFRSKLQSSHAMVSGPSQNRQIPAKLSPKLLQGLQRKRHTCTHLVDMSDCTTLLGDNISNGLHTTPR